MKYPCLVLDHDDTVVQSEKTLGYPFFCKILEEFRPGTVISLEDYVRGCHQWGFAGLCRVKWNFTPEELALEYRRWMDYVAAHIPEPFPGIGEVIRRQKAEGGRVMVVSHSSVENITRDYQTHFGILPDAIYGYDYPEHQRKPNPFPLLDIMEKYGYSRDEMLVVDDMQLAWQMANPLGVKLAFAGWGKAYFPELAREMEEISDFVFWTPEELGAFLFGK